MLIFRLALHQMLILAVFAGIGFLLRRKNLLSEEGVSGLSSVVMNVGLPCMILASFDMEYVPGTGVNILIFALLTVLSIALSGGVAHVFARWTHCPTDRMGSWLFGLMISNCGIIGFVIIYALYSGTALVYASIMVMIINTCTGLYVPSQQRRYTSDHSVEPLSRKESLKKALLRPIALTPVIGLIFYLTPLFYPPVVQDVLGTLKGLCSPLVLFVAGAGLANIRWKEVLRDRMIPLYCFLRLILIPVILGLILIPLPLEDNIKIIMIVGCAMPAPGLTPIIAEEYKGDVGFASEIVIISTILSVITIPFVTAALDMLL